jgi:uncharacterized membrane protein
MVSLGDGSSYLISITKYSRIIVAADILMGIGLAGLADTIIFHEILQWHHIISNVVAPISEDTIRYNVFVDGIFLSITVAAIVIGIALEILFIGRLDKGLPKILCESFSVLYC